jgi:hypothetical protein
MLKVRVVLGLAESCLANCDRYDATSTKEKKPSKDSNR